MDDCVFCAIAAGAAPAEHVYGDATAIAFMDINPATPGHTLVIPRRHARDLEDVGADDLKAMATTAQRVASKALGALGAAGVNLVLSSGREAFQTVFHIHLHIIPRYPDDAVRLPWIPAPGDPAVIAGVAGRLRAALA